MLSFAYIDQMIIAVHYMWTVDEQSELSLTCFVFDFSVSVSLCDQTLSTLMSTTVLPCDVT